MSKSPAVFDTVKLRWMNGEYLKAMDFDKFYEMAEPYIRQVITKDYDLKKIAAMVKTRIEVFPDIADHIDFFEAVPEYDISMYAHKKMKTSPESSLTVLQEILPVLEALDDYSNDAIYACIRDFVAEKGLQKWLCIMADPYSGFRQTDDSGWRNRDHGSHRQRGIISKDPCSDRKVAERNLKSI